MRKIRTSSWTLLPIRILFIILIVIIPICVYAETVFKPEVYFYPPPDMLSDGTLVGSPLMLNPDRITNLFPEIEEMSGVVVMMPWSEIEPNRGAFDFSSIDGILSYWKARQKKVILGISTSGPPFRAMQGDKPIVKSETPAWVADYASVYQDNDRLIGRIPGVTMVKDIVPMYWDPRFAPLYIELIQALGRRYDGDSTLSYMRIGTGRVGEDSPSPYGAHFDRIPDFDPIKWIDYSELIVDSYREAFPHLQLELDLDLMPWIYRSGNDVVKGRVDKFIDKLIQNGIFLAFNGWQANALKWHQNANNPGFALNRLMFYLDESRRRGHPIGLEGVGPMFVPGMQDIKKMADLARELQPKRLVFFGIDAAGISFVRHGPSAATDTSQRWLPDEDLRKLGELSIRLLDSVRQ